MLINEENMVMVALDLNRGVISSINSENGAAIKEPTLFDTKETPLDHEIETSILRNGSHSEKELEETEIKELEISLEPLSAEELNYDSEEPIIGVPPPRLTSISEELEPLPPHEEDEVLSSLDEETEVEALLDDFSKEKEKEQEEKSADLMDNESQAPNPEIRQKLKESLPEEIRRLFYPTDYPEAEATEPPPDKETTVPLNTAKAILKRQKLGAKQRKRLRKSKEKSMKEDEEPTDNESGSQIWWKNETIMQQILENPELYPPPNGFPLKLAPNTEDEPEPTFWDLEEEDDDESFTIG